VSEYSFEAADKFIRNAWLIEKGRGPRSMGIGFYGHQMKRANDWEAHGFRDEAGYRDRIGITTSLWGRMVRLASFFDELDYNRYILMTAANAELLASLPRENRYSAEWLEKAVRLKEEDFRREIIREKACAAGVPVPEMRVTYKVKCFEAQRTIITNALNEFRREHQIADEGTALEWLVLEYSARKTFVGFIQQQLAVLRQPTEFWDSGTIEQHITALAELLANLKGESIECFETTERG
jgi:hypothetical protein